MGKNKDDNGFVIVNENLSDDDEISYDEDFEYVDNMQRFTLTMSNKENILNLSPATPGSHPRLMRWNANPSPRRSITTPKLIDQFASYSYLLCYEALVSGFIRNLSMQSWLKSNYYVLSLAKLSQKFFFIAEDGYDQLAQQIFVLFKANDKKSFNQDALHLMVRQCLKLRNNDKNLSELAQHVKALLKYKYIVRINKGEKLFTFSMQYEILFDHCN